MMSQTPSVQSTLQAHSLSLTNLHVMDANHFLTVGMDPTHHPPPPSMPHPHLGPPPPPPSAAVGGSSSDESTTPPGGGGGAKTHLQSEPFSIIPPSGPDALGTDMSQLSIQPSSSSSDDDPPGAGLGPPDAPVQCSVKSWEYGKPPHVVKSVGDVGDVVSSSFHCHNPPGNLFLGLGLRNGVIKIFNVPNFTISSELHFPEMKGQDCMHVRLNLSREAPLITAAYYRNPFRDLILTSAWSDGKVMVCQVKKQ